MYGIFPASELTPAGTGAGYPDPRRVALVSHTNSLYGAGRSLLELLHGLRQAGLEVGVVLPAGGPLGRKLKEHGCRVWNRTLPVWVQSSGSGDQGPAGEDFEAAAADLRRFLSRWGADLVWSNSTITPVGAMAAERLGIPHVWHLRELNGPACGFEFNPGSAAARLISRSSRRVAVSRTVKEHYEGLGCGECDWVYNGIDSAERLAVRQRRARGGAPLRLLIVGRITPVKGQLAAIEATGHLRRAGYPVELRVVGGGDVEGCRRRAIQLGIGGCVAFTGFAECPETHYRWADIALSCCRIEAMGRATAEAMSWALPVAGFDAAGTAELVKNSGGGLLCSGGSEALAGVIATLIDDGGAAAAMGAAGQHWARTHASSDRHARRIGEIVAALLAPATFPQPPSAPAPFRAGPGTPAGARAPDGPIG